MPKVLKVPVTGLGPKPKYPWAKWFNGKKHTLTKGVDFHSTAQSFRNYAYGVMSKHMLKYTGLTEKQIAKSKPVLSVTVAENSKTLTIQVHYGN